jgi:hypothetical protein
VADKDFWWDMGSMKPANNYIFLYGIVGNANHHFFKYNGIRQLRW